MSPERKTDTTSVCSFSSTEYVACEKLIAGTEIKSYFAYNMFELMYNSFMHAPHTLYGSELQATRIAI